MHFVKTRVLLGILNIIYSHHQDWGSNSQTAYRPALGTPFPISPSSMPTQQEGGVIGHKYLSPASPTTSWQQPQPTPFTILNTNPFDGSSATRPPPSSYTGYNEAAPSVSCSTSDQPQEPVRPAGLVSLNPTEEAYQPDPSSDSPPSRATASATTSGSHIDLRNAPQPSTASSQPAPPTLPSTQFQTAASAAASAGAAKLVGVLHSSAYMTSC